MDDYLALSLIIMGIAIGALLVIWGAMSLAFFLRKKHRAKKLQERIAEREAAEAKYRAELQQEEQNSQNDNRKSCPDMGSFLYCEASRLFFFLGVVCVHKLNYLFL